MIEGTMDTAGAYDTYRFTLAAAAKVSMMSRWETGFDDIDLFFWDENLGQAYTQQANVDREPASGSYLVSPSALPVTPYYVSTYFYFAGGLSTSTGQKYIILVTATP